MFVFENSFEVALKLGGIYTVLRSKVPAQTAELGDNYCLVGQYEDAPHEIEFDACEAGPVWLNTALEDFKKTYGIDYAIGKWLITGRPLAVLLQIKNNINLDELKTRLYEQHKLETPETGVDPLTDKVVIFGETLHLFYQIVMKHAPMDVVAHFHEWMTASCMCDLARFAHPKLKTVFTTHATMMSRYLCVARGLDFYINRILHAHDEYDWVDDAKEFGIYPRVLIEYKAAHACNVFTTVSEITGKEARVVLHRQPDFLLPNGLNISKFEIPHHLQNLHQENKHKLQKFCTSHFFPSYSFDLDKTMFFFTSGRFEPQNKGFDFCIESMARLNYQMQANNIDKTVVFFIVTRTPTENVLPDLLEQRALSDQIEETLKDIGGQISTSLYDRVIHGSPLCDDGCGKGSTIAVENHISETSWLKLRRLRHAFNRDELPPVTTHRLVNDNDEIIEQIRKCQLFNNEHDKVKIIYHPDFINSASPLFQLDYSDFVRGCHMGIFPSAYEPWGLTPPECVVSSVPCITSDLAGFGAWMKKSCPEHDKYGIYIAERSRLGDEKAIDQMVEILMRFLSQDRWARIKQRNKAFEASKLFGWNRLVKDYLRAYGMIQ
ncbi:hypothetical protein PCE1_004278 [Barthelona sp. PCE]